MMKEKRSEHLHVRIAPSIKAMLDELAEEKMMTQADVVEELVTKEVSEMTGRNRETETRYIVMEENRKGDKFEKGRFLTLESANKRAEEEWRHMSDEDKKNNNIIVYSEEGYWEDGEWMSDEPLSDIPEGAMDTTNPKQVRNIIEANKGVVDIEVYERIGAEPVHFHTDSIRALEEFDMNAEAKLYEVMDEQIYDNTVLANSSVKADFAEWYDDDGAEVLCIII